MFGWICKVYHFQASKRFAVNKIHQKPKRLTRPKGYENRFIFYEHKAGFSESETNRNRVETFIFSTSRR